MPLPPDRPHQPGGIDRNPSGERVILLADADAFYVAVARLEDPEGAGRARLLIVGGSPDGRGVVTSASYEAREYGVRSAMPTAQALRLCPEATVAPVSRAACSEKSRAIRTVLEEFTPVVEAASIDEFYLDMTGTERLYRSETIAETAGRIRERVLARTQIRVSIGGGSNRLVAKLAARQAKPRPGREGSGVHIVPRGKEAEFVSGLALAAIPMIGPKFQERLARYGLRTVKDALQYDRATLQSWFGERSGDWLYDRVRGIEGSRVLGRVRSRSMGHEETFARDIESDEELDRELMHLALRVASDLRSKRLTARTLTVKLRDSDFTTRTRSRTLEQAISSDAAILEVSRTLLRRLRRSRRRPARLLGVTATGLESGLPGQIPLFDDPDATLETRQDRQLSRTLDEINRRFGKGRIRRGRLLG